MGVKPEVADAVRKALSVSRISTYEQAVSAEHPADAALDLYQWNATISAAFMLPLHICEVVIRNAVAEGLEATYGAKWPWSAVFEASLPSAAVGYNQRLNLRQERDRHSTTGKVIAELKFVFWQKMFTRRHDTRLWDRHLRYLFPRLDPAQPVAELRDVIYNDLEQIRLLRNRIAHHEPIFSRDLASDFQRIHALIHSRCPLTASWMSQAETVRQSLASRPLGSSGGGSNSGS
ncbi:hypothetical protein F183_A03230 [Bryobacterales bacterium F-183]|nr:hypothetical protein F183_A03230 [Bryobacterales bacterium F-183]